MPVDLPEVLQTNHVMNHLLSNKSIQHIKIKIILNSSTLNLLCINVVQTLNQQCVACYVTAKPH